MRKTHLMPGALAVGLMLLGVALQVSARAPDNTVEGTVMRAGDSRLALMLSSSDEIRLFVVAPDAAISRDGKKVTLEEVTVGDFAFVIGKPHEETPIATTIVALTPLSRP